MEPTDPSGLSREDSLRLNVLLASKPQAIRIHEGSLIVQGLGPQGESTVRLRPTTRSDQYLRRVRALISGHVLGSPSGYPLYLRRWTRMGQMRHESLEQLLLLGEPEAVVAAASSPGLDDELARRAWWALEDADNARRMLNNPRILQGSMGPVLADYLIDYLPFETESEAIIESVRLVLQPGLLEETRRLDLWRKASRKQLYLVGFLRALPDDLPDGPPARALADSVVALAREGDPCARLLARVYSRGGQAFVTTAGLVLSKPPNQDVVTITMDCLRDYFGTLRQDGNPDLSLEDLTLDVERFLATGASHPLVGEVLRKAPDLAPDIEAMRFLSGVGYGLMRPLLRDPTTIGSLMRRKLAPVMDAILARLDLLRGMTG